MRQERVEEVRSPNRGSNSLPRDAENLIIQNGNLVEELLNTEVWKNIVEPVFIERVASVCGRFTNGRWIHGELTRSKSDGQYLSGYQRAIMDIRNDIDDFVVAKNRQKERMAAEESSKNQPVYNPFLEDENE